MKGEGFDAMKLVVGREMSVEVRDAVAEAGRRRARKAGEGRVGLGLSAAREQDGMAPCERGSASIQVPEVGS